MIPERSFDELRARAARAGLKLSEDELQQLLPGVNRSHHQARELRALVAEDDEPAAIFMAASSKKE
jgi:hypothetical protein